MENVGVDLAALLFDPHGFIPEQRLSQTSFPHSDQNLLKSCHTEGFSLFHAHHVLKCPFLATVGSCLLSVESQIAGCYGMTS